MARAQVKVTRSEPVYKFDELSDSAKEKAREWYREGAQDHDWWDGVYDDAKECGKLIGIEIEGKGQSSGINFSGFWSQGDGACFDGKYAYPEFDAVERAPTKLIRQHAPKDAQLHHIADTFEELQAKLAVLQPGARLTAATRSNCSHYSHSGTMNIDTDWQIDDAPGLNEIESDLLRAMRDFADWIYHQLEKEYEWLNADAQVDESITANEYTFDEDGNREG